MKTYIVIEADTSFHSLFAYIVSRESDGCGDNYIYKRSMGSDTTVQEIEPAKFFGQVNALMPTQETINHAKPLALAADALAKGEKP